jgi:hypothetical protein
MVHVCPIEMPVRLLVHMARDLDKTSGTSITSVISTVPAPCQALMYVEASAIQTMSIRRQAVEFRLILS